MFANLGIPCADLAGAIDIVFAKAHLCFFQKFLRSTDSGVDSPPKKALPDSFLPSPSLSHAFIPICLHTRHLLRPGIAHSRHKFTPFFSLLFFDSMAAHDFVN